MPPGSARNASLRSAIICLRSCMVSTTCSSLTARWPTSRSISVRGMTPTTGAPAASAASATTPISPTQPPP
jgi:hypothetical protein